MSEKNNETCPKCGKIFTCSTSGKCWCYEVNISQKAMDYIEDAFDSCLCPDCLKELSKK